jgi:hypothetical protein
MHVSIDVKSPNNIRKWQMGFKSAFKGLKLLCSTLVEALAVVPAQEPSFLECYAVSTGKQLWAFRKNIVLSSSG